MIYILIHLELILFKYILLKNVSFDPLEYINFLYSIPRKLILSYLLKALLKILVILLYEIEHSIFPFQKKGKK